MLNFIIMNNKIKKNNFYNFYNFYSYFVKQKSITFFILIHLSCISAGLYLLTTPYFNKILIDRISISSDFCCIILPLFFLFLSKVFSCIINRTFDYIWTYFIIDLRSKVRKYLIEHVFITFIMQTCFNPHKSSSVVVIKLI